MEKFPRREEMYAWLGEVAGKRVAEIGVWRGDNAVKILEWAEPDLLVLVDRWKKVDEPSNQDMMGLDRDIIEHAYPNTVLRFLHRREVVVVRAESMKAISIVGGAGFDWVYIDATHTKEAVKQDIIEWGRCVECLGHGKNGYIAGHDYGSTRHPGVKEAVDELVASGDYELVALTEDMPASYALRVKEWEPDIEKT